MFYSCVVSLQVSRTQTRDIRKFEPKSHSFPIPVNENIIDWPSSEIIVDECRALLNKVFVDEYGWIPDISLNTGYNYRNSNILKDFPKMLCDRFDDTALWVVIMSEEYHVVGYLRLVYDLSTGLDIIASPRCPNSFLEWYKETIQYTSIIETERIVLDSKHRRYNLMCYLLYLAASYALNPINNIPCRILIGTFSVPQLIRFAMNMGSKTKPEWIIKYSEKDEPAQIVVLDYHHLQDNPDLLKCVISRARL